MAMLAVRWLAKMIVVVHLGQEIQFEIGTSPERWSEIVIDTETVVELKGNNVLYAVGKSPGASWVTVTGVRGGTRSALVIVPR